MTENGDPWWKFNRENLFTLFENVNEQMVKLKQKFLYDTASPPKKRQLHPYI